MYVISPTQVRSSSTEPGAKARLRRSTALVSASGSAMVVALKRRRQRPIRPRWRMMRATRLRLAQMPSRRSA